MYKDDISEINRKIPEQASASNQLADKEFVNSSISTNTAIFRGTFDSFEELEAYAGAKTVNDYAFVIVTDTSGNVSYNRYKYNGNEWIFEYTLNNSSFTAEQWSAINSGITSEKVEEIKNPIDDEASDAEHTWSAQKIGEALGDVNNSWTGTLSEWEDFDKSELKDGTQVNIIDDLESKGGIDDDNVGEFTTYSSKKIENSFASKSLEVYSTEETVCGVWIDGKPIYRRYFSFSNVVIADAYLNLVANTFNAKLIIKGIMFSFGDSYTIEDARFHVTNNYIQGYLSYHSSYVDAILIEYTKTTD